MGQRGNHSWKLYIQKICGLWNVEYVVFRRGFKTIDCIADGSVKLLYKVIAKLAAGLFPLNDDALKS